MIHLRKIPRADLITYISPFVRLWHVQQRRGCEGCFSGVEWVCFSKLTKKKTSTWFRSKDSQQQKTVRIISVTVTAETIKRNSVHRSRNKPCKHNGSIEYMKILITHQYRTCQYRWCANKAGELCASVTSVCRCFHCGCVHVCARVGFFFQVVTISLQSWILF